MNRKTAIAVVLSAVGVALVAGVGFGALAPSDAGPRVEAFAVVESGCADANYTSEIEQRRVESGTEIAVTDTFVGGDPATDLSAEARTADGSSADYALRITSDGDPSESDCRGELTYEAVVFVPETTDFRLAVVHDGEVETVVTAAGNRSSVSSSSAASP